jgi:hypothetical protein
MNKRIKSFLWRLGAYIVVAALAFIVKNISELELPDVVVMLVTLLSGEATKWLNTKYELEAKVGSLIKR